MSAFYLNMTDLKKQITIVFLGIFILVKISPTYFAEQSLRFNEMSKSRGTAIRTASHEHFLVSIDKGIIEVDNLKFIPKIKFSGILFALISADNRAICITNHENFYFLKYALAETKKYLSLGVLRL